MRELKKPSRKQLLAGVLAFVIGALWISAIRFVAYQPDTTHYHANFAVYINGQRQQFDSFGFYEEVAQCSTDASDPHRRAHMHDMINHVVHVHDKEVTWGNFFENLGFTLGDNVLATTDAVYSPTADKKLSFMLNGEPVNFVANKIIESEDVLLINYGPKSDTNLQERYSSIEQDAKTYNQTADPSACSGEAEASLSARFKHAFGL